MKTIKSVIPRVLGFFLILTILCGVGFPLVITGIAKVFFPKQAAGSLLIGEDGTKYGSGLMGQQFTEDQYLWGRIMNVDTTTFTGENGEPLMYSWASNQSPAGEKLEELIAERVKKIRAAQPENADQPIPQDLVTCSGSGLDPAISPAAAYFQAARIAKARGISEEEVRKIIETYTTGRALGIFGEPAVNVLKVNLALDGIEWKE